MLEDQVIQQINVLGQEGCEGVLEQVRYLSPKHNHLNHEVPFTCARFFDTGDDFVTF